METSRDPRPGSGIALSPQDLEHLGTAARWARIVALVGFALLGLLILFGALYGAFMNKVMHLAASANPGMATVPPFPAAFFSVVMVLVMVVCAAIYFFPLFYLYRFAVNTQRALHHMELTKLTEALRYLRAHLIYIGVLTIIGAVLYGFMLLFMLAMMVFINSDSMPVFPQA